MTGRVTVGAPGHPPAIGAVSHPSDLSSSSADLVARIRAGDSRAFEELFRREYAPLCRFADRYVRDGAASEDLVQDLFASVWSGRGRLDVRGSVRAYLFTAARNRALNARKDTLVEREWARDESASEVRALHRRPRRPDDRLDEAERDARIRTAISHLPERCRLVMQLRWQEQLSYPDIASIMGISLKGVELQLARGIGTSENAAAEMHADPRHAGGGFWPAGFSLRRTLPPASSHGIDWRIIDRHLAGECTPDDERAIRVWLAGDPRNAQMIQAVRVAARGADRRNEPRWIADRAWSRVATRMREPHDDSVLPLRRRDSTTRWTRTRLIGSAAGALAAAAAVVFVAQHPSGPPSGTPATSRRHEVVAAAARQTRVTLGDGTRVVLNARSRLRYGDFGRGPREVELEGEGYFDVVHDEMRSFRVHARGSIAEDVGTRFVVRAYPDESTVDVVVTHGSVLLRREQSAVPPMLLVAGQHGRIGTDGVITRLDEGDVDRWLEWTRRGTTN